MSVATREAVRRPPLVEAILPRASLLTRVVAVVVGSLVTALAAQVEIRIPGSPVPLTGQTFGVVVIGAALGSRAGAAAMLVYLAEGLAGLPVFAGGASGAAHLLGPTGGYLIGFVPAAFVTGWLAERGFDRSVWTAFLAMLIGSIPIFALGLAWLARFVPASSLLGAGLYPFILGDILKSLVAAGVLPGAWRLAAVGGMGRSSVE
jgi:biotin transport system substrate-specific component